MWCISYWTRSTCGDTRWVTEALWSSVRLLLTWQRVRRTVRFWTVMDQGWLKLWKAKPQIRGGGGLLYYPLGFCDHQMRERIWKSLPGIQRDRGSMNAGHCCHETGPQLILPYLLALTKTRNSIGQIRYSTSWWLSWQPHAAHVGAEWNTPLSVSAKHFINYLWIM